MTSEISSISRFISQENEFLLEHSTPNGTLPYRLLSPIAEDSVEILSTSFPLNKSYSNTSQQTLNPVMINNNLNQTLLQRSYQYINHFYNIQNYLNTLDEHFKSLLLIIEYLRNDKNLFEIIELFETRLLQMRVKRNQIDRLLNYSSIKTILQQITPFLHQSKLNINHDEFIHSIQLSLNQKTILLDHVQNEYRYRKYQLQEYSSKFQEKNELFIKLTKQIEEYLVEHKKNLHKKSYLSRSYESKQQSIELMKLSTEYEQLKTENYFLILKTKENIERISLFIQSNHH